MCQSLNLHTPHQSHIRWTMNTQLRTRSKNWLSVRGKPVAYMALKFPSMAAAGRKTKVLLSWQNWKSITEMLCLLCNAAVYHFKGTTTCRDRNVFICRNIFLSIFLFLIKSRLFNYVTRVWISPRGLWKCSIKRCCDQNGWKVGDTQCCRCWHLRAHQREWDRKWEGNVQIQK